MIKLNILDMNNFLNTVNACRGTVHMLCPDGKKVDINKAPGVQRTLWEQFSQNRSCLHLTLEIPNPGDYMSIVSYYAGDC